RMSQAQLAKKVGTRQSAISRLETGALSTATVATLKKIADALDMRLVVKLRAKKSARA
ncbi:MAG: XRE family transcriptional regulator, partial [Nitrospiraceae bacterium]